MSDKLVWSNHMTQDYFSRLPLEAAKAELVDYGYDPDMLADLDQEGLQNVIADDFSMDDQDYEYYDEDIAPELSKQSDNGNVIVSKDGDGFVFWPEDLYEFGFTDGNVAIRDIDGQLHLIIDSRVYPMYCIDDAEKFVRECMMNAVEDEMDFRDDISEEDAIQNVIMELDDNMFIDNYIEYDKVPNGCVPMAWHGDVAQESLEEKCEECNNSDLELEEYKRFMEESNDICEADEVEPEVEIDMEQLRELFNQLFELNGLYELENGFVPEYIEGLQKEIYFLLQEEESPENLRDIKDIFDELLQLNDQYEADGVNVPEEIEGLQKEILFMLEDLLAEGKEVDPEELPINEEVKGNEGLQHDLDIIKNEVEKSSGLGFYEMPFDEFKELVPDFAEKILNDYIKFAELDYGVEDPQEIEDMWHNGEYIIPDDWEVLIRATQRVINKIEKGKPASTLFKY